MRAFNSAFELTRIPRNNVRASLPKKDFNQIQPRAVFRRENEFEAVGHTR